MGKGEREREKLREERVEAEKREARSLMPDNYGRLFTNSDLDDLVAFLNSLRGTK